MRERKVPDAAVRFVLDAYHTLRPAPRRADEPATVIYIGEYQGKDLKVYVERDTNPPVVRTVAWGGD